ncbi:MAG: LAGLIDADG family homing endonuclease [Candidatus Methylomirabilales bacterium]
MTICLGKCLPGHTRVLDAATGALLPLRDFVAKRAGLVLTLDGHRLRRGEVTRHLAQGVQPTFRLTTRTGRVIEATASHPFLTFEGWTPLHRLRVGSRIAVPRSLPCFGQVPLPPHEAVLLGLLLSDGQCATPGHSPRYTSGDPVLREVLAGAARAFGCEVTRVGEIGVNVVNRPGRGGIMRRNRCATWLEALGVNVRSREKFVPPVLFTADRSSVRLFLQALFSGDGGITRSGDDLHLEYSSASERLARDVQHLLLRLGIVGFLRKRWTNRGTTAFILTVTAKGDILRFAEAIGFLPGTRKDSRLHEVVQYIAGMPERKSNFDTLPREAWEMVRGAAASAGRSLRSLGVDGTQPNQSVPRDLVRQVAEGLSDEALLAVADSDILWDTVSGIEPAGEQEVFDLTVEGTANFVANDILVHNSTYARCGIIVNVTPFEPEWEGTATLEISNTTPLPAKIYANEGIAQVVFFRADEPCEVSYRDKQGKYQAQRDITLPRI